MAKLVDLLARHLKEWPDGANYIEQGLSGALYSQSNIPVGFIKEVSEDAIRVTYNQYITARDRLHAETVKDMRDPTNADADQALWDKVASNVIGGLSEKDWNDYGVMVEHSMGIADAFMAERAKRLKGGV